MGYSALLESRGLDGHRLSLKLRSVTTSASENLLMSRTASSNSRRAASASQCGLLLAGFNCSDWKMRGSELGKACCWWRWRYGTKMGLWCWHFLAACGTRRRRVGSGLKDAPDSRVIFASNAAPNASFKHFGAYVERNVAAWTACAAKGEKIEPRGCEQNGRIQGNSS